MAARIDFSKLSLMDALDLARLIEVEAFDRYTLFAKQIGPSYTENAGSFFASMAVNEKRHGDQLAARRTALFGNQAPNVKLDDLFDVEAPEVGAPRWNMSHLQACQLALSSEKKAFAFYDMALPSLTNPDIKELFEELRDEEAEHIRMIEEVVAKLPPSAAIEVTDADETS
jgi:erythrin-vacuolar iron transport family protein